MPEGPEVAVITQQLKEILEGHTLINIRFLSGRYAKNGPPDNLDILDLPQKVELVGCHGKFIYIILENDTAIHNTLGMTGTWSPTKQKHSRVCLNLGTFEAHFVDTRNFGTLKFTESAGVRSKIESLGWDVLDELHPVVFKHMMKRLRKRKGKTITQILMDQTLFAGVGNYLKAEILYQCQLSPHRLGENLTDFQWEQICKTTHRIAKESLSHRGTTIRDYRDVTGESGNFQNFLKVYGKKVDPLGNEVIKESTKDGRTTHWVPEVQK